MDGRSSGDSKKWGEGSSSGSRKGKRNANSDPNNKRERKKGLGIAALERIRIETEMEQQYRRNCPGHPPPFPTANVFSLEEDAMASITLPSSSHPNIGASQPYPYPYPTHPNFVMAYGVRGDMTYGQFQSTIIRPPCAPEAASYSDPSNAMPPMNIVTLPLFEVRDSQEEESVHFETEGDSNESTSRNPNDPADVDLELKL